MKTQAQKIHQLQMLSSSYDLSEKNQAYKSNSLREVYENIVNADGLLSNNNHQSTPRCFRNVFRAEKWFIDRNKLFTERNSHLELPMWVFGSQKFVFSLNSSTVHSHVHQQSIHVELSNNR